MKGMIFKSAAVLFLAALAGTVFAQDAALDLPRASSAYIRDYESFKLAANDQETLVKKSNSAAPEVKRSEFEPSWLTGSKVHQYLGLATIAGAALTALAAPDSGCEHNCTTTSTKPRETNGTHAHLAKATVALAAATVITGVLVHWDDIHLEDGIRDPDNLHVIFGVTGAALMAYAVNKSKNSAVPVSHAGIAELGALGMVVAIKLTW
jgi:hypothetical protein